MSHTIGKSVTEVHEHSPPTVAPRGTYLHRHWTLARIGLYLLLAALPLLAISVQVFGLVSMNTTTAFVIIPLAAALVVLCVFAPHPTDRIVGHGLVWGMFACLVYDVFRLDTVYMLDLWGDFIPKMGTWVHSGSDTRTGAVVGYLWRYVGDGGGIGITFFILAVAVGLQHLSRRAIIFASITFAVFPVWSGLIATVALAPRGQEHMFPLTPTTLTLSLIGHLIFGLVMGLGFLRARRTIAQHWPWPPLLRSARKARIRNSRGPKVASCGSTAPRQVKRPRTANIVHLRSAERLHSCGCADDVTVR